MAGGVWDDGSTVFVLAKPDNLDGQLVICGAWTVYGRTVNTSYFNDRIVQAGSVWIGGQPAARGLGGFREVLYADDMTGKQASCLPTGWPCRRRNRSRSLRLSAEHPLLSGQQSLPRHVIDLEPNAVGIFEQ